MSPGTGSNSSNVGTVIPAAWETAINDLRTAEWDASNEDNPPSKSSKVKQAVELWLAVLKTQGELPEDAQDDVEGIDADSVLSSYGLVATDTTGAVGDDLEVDA